jgi:hypothetical protein
MSYVKEIDDAAGSTSFISISRCSAYNLAKSLVAVCLETDLNRGCEHS